MRKLLTYLFFLHCNTIQSWPAYRLAIPNGNSVPDPCVPAGVWAAVGHSKPAMFGPRNPFGEDFLRLGLTWNRKLCLADSDGDGLTNGEELGDPSCVWTKERYTQIGPAKSHPGICEPMDSPRCQRQHFKYDCKTKSNKMCHHYLRNDTLELPINMSGTHVPIKSSSYVCMEVRLPSERDYHLLAAKPVIDKTDNVHQIQLFACDSGLESRVYNHPFECGEKPRGDCQSLIGGFSRQEHGICFPPNSGFKIGTNGCKQLVVQVQYKNQQLNHAVYDSSGLVLYYTSNLETFDIGTKLISVTHFTLPVGSRNNNLVTGEYPSECSEHQISRPIFVTSAFTHMHMYGRKQRILVIRNGVPMHNIAEGIEYKAYHLQGAHFDKPIKVIPGDSLKIECEYDTTTSKTNITWGLLSTNEMCSATLMYYPRENWLQATATSFKSIPLCKLQTTGEVNGCHFGKLFEAVRHKDETSTALAHCSAERVCTQGCSVIASMAFQHPCLQGENYDLLQSRLTKKFQALKNMMETLDLCMKQPPNLTTVIPVTVINQPTMSTPSPFVERAGTMPTKPYSLLHNAHISYPQKQLPVNIKRVQSNEGHSPSTKQFRNKQVNIDNFHHQTPGFIQDFHQNPTSLKSDAGEFQRVDNSFFPGITRLEENFVLGPHTMEELAAWVQILQRPNILEFQRRM